MKLPALLLMVSLVGTGCMHVEHTTNYNALDGVEAACTVVANSYPYYRDQLDYAAYGELFTEDAVFDLSDYSAATGKIIGRAAIVEALRARGPSATTRHLNQVVHMEAVDETHVNGVSYLVLFSDSGSQTTQPALPKVVAEYHDRFRVDNGQCKIAERRLQIVF